MMYVLPQPYAVMEKNEEFRLDYRTYLVLSKECSPRVYRQAQILKEAIEKNTGLCLHLTKGEARQGDIQIQGMEGGKDTEAYRLSISPAGVEIAGTESSIFWGMQTLIQIIEQCGTVLPGIKIVDTPALPNRGFYHDVTRGRVPKLETLKKLADKLSRYKMNQLQLYIEHTYLFRDFSEVWRDDTPLTPEDILELDAYCMDRNIELIPSISTCSHLDKVLRTQSYKDLCELDNPDQGPHTSYSRMQHHTVNICDPAAMEMVKQMIAEYRPLFHSDKFNICADETFDLGKGKSRAYCEEKGVGNAYVEYVSQLCSYVKTLGCTPMMWGDIIVKYPDLLSQIPEDTIFLNWWYEADVTDEDTKCFAKAGVPFYNCPGVSGWSRLVNDNQNAYENIRRMAAYAKECGASGLLNTDWGDFYHFAHPEFSYIGLIYGAQMSWGKEMSQAELNRSISALEFGWKGPEKHSLADSLCQISENNLYSWMHFCILKENQEDPELLERSLEKGFSDAGISEKVEEVCRNLEELQNILGRAMADTAPESRELLGAYILAADGCKLFNRLGKVIFLRECSKTASKESQKEADWKLAKDLEYWLMAMKDLYRSVSQESELARWQDVIIWYCDYLRGKEKIQ